MFKQCKICNQNFEITEEDLAFYEKISPVFNDQKYLIPNPSLCPLCRTQRRLSSKNERYLYKRKCDMTGKEVISVYNEKSPYKIYSNVAWWSDNWDPLSYGRDFDFNKTFFEQFNDLINAVPHFALFQGTSSENCEYANYGTENKSCYMSPSCAWCEDIYHSSTLIKSKDCLDCFKCVGCELCYECIDCNICNRLLFSKDCNGCSESYFLEDCSNCQNCFCSAGLRNKQYIFCNEQLSKEEYLKKINNISLTNSEIAKWKDNLAKISLQIPHKYYHGINNEEVSGDYIDNSKNLDSCFDCLNLVDCKYCSFAGYQTKDLLDCDYTGAGSELCYEALSAISLNKSAFIYYCTALNDCYYCKCCFSSSNLFGCVGLNHKQYCVLNKQYTQEEYEKLVPRIIEHMKKSTPLPPLSGGQNTKSPPDKGDLGGLFLQPEWGEFFPSSISPFGYNETIADEYFHLTREETISKGFKWSDYEPEFPKVDKIIPANLLPEKISEIPDDILNWAVECEKTKKPFKIIKAELGFYRKMNLPIPHLHPDERHKTRMALRNPRKLFDRNCMKCNAEIKTTYSPERTKIIYCENCYLNEVY